jgi:hypothetical protein
VILSTGLLLLLELSCYVTIFFEQIASTESVSAYLSEAVVKKRQKTNAVTLSGQFATWMAGGWYIVTGLFISFASHSENGREIAAVFRLTQFGIIPVIEIFTSPPLKRFVIDFFR